MVVELANPSPTVNQSTTHQDGGFPPKWKIRPSLSFTERWNFTLCNILLAENQLLIHLEIWCDENWIAFLTLSFLPSSLCFGVKAVFLLSSSWLVQTSQKWIFAFIIVSHKLHVPTIGGSIGTAKKQIPWWGRKGCEVFSWQAFMMTIRPVRIAILMC